MKVKLPQEVTDADRPFVCSRGNADGSVILYYDGDDIPQIPEVQPPATPAVTIQDFRQRFTDAELLSVLSSTDAQVRLLLLKLQTRQEIELTDPQVLQGMGYLVSLGLLTKERANHIIGTDVPPVTLEQQQEQTLWSRTLSFFGIGA